MEYKILLVEDNDGFRRIYRDVLNHAGYSVLEAQSGESGLSMARENSPDLILLDIMLPEMDGFEVLKNIRAEDKTKHTPIIMFSVLGEDKGIVKSIELGANDYIIKGVDSPREVLKKVKVLLGK